VRNTNFKWARVLEECCAWVVFDNTNCSSKDSMTDAGLVSLDNVDGEEL